MTTHLANQIYCSCCGSDGAPLRCPCRRANYCNAGCQKKAWSEHLLNCTKAKESSKFRAGDVDEISGLKSTTGLTLNGKLAEVHKPLDETTGRIGVLLTVNDELKIKSAALKPDNLKMKLSAVEAAKRGAQLEKKLKSEAEIDHTQTNATFMREWMALMPSIPSLSGEEIVQHIRENDEAMIQALAMMPGKEISSLPLIEKMHRSGLAAACLETFQFPETIDVNTDVRFSPPLLLNIVGNTLSGGPHDPPSHKPRLDGLRLEVCRLLGPIIMVCATKKRRLYGRTEQWWQVQGAVMQLLYNCLLAQKVGARSLVKELDPVVADTLIGFLISSLTVDPTLYLRTQSPVATGKVNFLCEEEDLVDRVAMNLKLLTPGVLLHLVDITVVGERFIRRIGEFVIPAGAPGLTGLTFAECFLDCAAKLVLEQERCRTGYPDQFVYGNLSEQIHFIYSMLLKSPKLLTLMGGVDETFAQLDSPTAFLHWARSRKDANRS